MLVAFFANKNNQGESMNKLIRDLIRLFNVKRGYYNEEGKPLVCPFCDCGKIDEHIVGLINNDVCEIDYKCSKCGKRVGFWAYGSYDPDYMDTFYWETLI